METKERQKDKSAEKNKPRLTTNNSERREVWWIGEIIQCN